MMKSIAISKAKEMVCPYMTKTAYNDYHKYSYQYNPKCCTEECMAWQFKEEKVSGYCTNNKEK